MKVIEFEIPNLNFVKKKIHRHFLNIFIYMAKQFMMTKKIQVKSTFLEDGASGVQVGDIGQVTI